MRGEPSIDDCKKALRTISATPAQELLVAEEDGRVVGATMLVIVHGLAHNVSPWAVLEYTVVDEQYRRRSIGKLMLEYAAIKAKEAGCYKIMLSSNKKRKDAHRFYRSLGFVAGHEGFQRRF
jgi:GNAT superfamily N-acetyltransferase